MFLWIKLTWLNLLLSGVVQQPTVASPLSFPAGWSAQQRQMASLIISEAKKKRLCPHTFVALAWHESSLNPKASSGTRDVGLFQINYFWHHKQLGFSNYKDFKRALSQPLVNAHYSFAVMAKLSWSRFCRKNNIFACYNGGYGWRQSKNREKIVAYRKEVVRKRAYLVKAFPSWVQKN